MKKNPSIFIQYLIALVMAVALVSLIALRTNSMPPQSDAHEYVEMARHGIIGNPNLIAPFAYRPGVPLLSRAISSLFNLDVKFGFRIVGWISMVALLLGIFTLSRTFISDFRKALLPMLILGLSFYHIKFPLFFYSLVDVAAYPLIVFSFWAFITRKFYLCLLLSVIGVFFKEFLVIPMILLIIQLGVIYWHSKNKQDLFKLGVVLVICLSAILVPRLLIPVKSTEQFVDPLNDLSTLSNLVSAPFDELRFFNIIFSVVSYWLPVLLLMTIPRFKKVWLDLKERSLLVWCGIYLFLVLLLTMYGGTNIAIFISYSIAVQAVVLALLIRNGIGMAEIVYTFVVMLIFNKTIFNLPDPTVNIDTYIDYYGGWSSRVSPRTIVRFLDAGIFIALAALLRFVTPKISSSLPKKESLPPA